MGIRQANKQAQRIALPCARSPLASESDMKSIAELLDYFEEDEESAYCELVPEESIAEAEYFLKITFPKSYKKFLLAAGTGEGKAGRFAGLGTEGFLDSKLAEDVELMKKWSHVAAQGKLIPFADDFSGNFYCFDSRKMNRDGEFPVVFWDRLFQFDREPEPVADDFIGFMNQSIDDTGV